LSRRAPASRSWCAFDIVETRFMAVAAVRVVAVGPSTASPAHVQHITFKCKGYRSQDNCNHALRAAWKGEIVAGKTAR